MPADLNRVLFVGGLDESVNEKIIQDIFSAFGDIKNIDLPLNPVTKKHRGFVFIEFLEEEDAKHALFNMNNFEMFGKKIHVNFAKTRKGEQYKPVWLDDLYNEERMKAFDEVPNTGEEKTNEPNVEGHEKEIEEIQKFTTEEKKRLEELFLL